MTIQFSPAARPKVGDRITYTAHNGERRTITVETVDDDIKNGRPGFDGVTDDGYGVWGYDDQIVTGPSGDYPPLGYR